MHSVTDSFTEVLSWSISSLVIAKYFKIMGTIICFSITIITMILKHFILKSTCWLTSSGGEPWTIRLDEG
jgi:hypothetical protein